MNQHEIKSLSNTQLVSSAEKYFDIDRQTTHILLLHLKEIEARKLYADYGYPDMFKMLIGHFKQSESSANQRRYALKLMNDVPAIEDHLKSGDLNLSTLAMAQKQIAQEEKITGIKVVASKKAEIVEQISGKTMAQAEIELMTLLPESSKTLKNQERRISKDEVRLSLTIPNRVKEKLEKLRNHIAAANPKMDHVEVIERALDMALAKVDPTQRPLRRRERRPQR